MPTPMTRSTETDELSTVPPHSLVRHGVQCNPSPQLPQAEPHDALSEAESYGVYRCHPVGARSGKWGTLSSGGIALRP
jgi:hypothetical protein